MPAARTKRIRVKVELANTDDLAACRRGLLAAKNVKRCKVAALIDSSVSGLMLPSGVAKKLGLRVDGKIKVEQKDASFVVRDRVDCVDLELQGRDGTYRAYLDPNRRIPVIGWIVLNDLDLLVDVENGKIFPRDPRYVIVET